MSQQQGKPCVRCSFCALALMISGFELFRGTLANPDLTAISDRLRRPVLAIAKAKGTADWPSLGCFGNLSARLDRLNVLSLPALRSLDHVELNGLAFLK